MTRATTDEITGDTLEKRANMRVILSSCGNPDYNQDPYRPVPGVLDKTVLVSSFAEAAKHCREYISENNLGSGNWNGGDVYFGAEVIARVSYNGRVWALEPDPAVAKEIQTLNEAVKEDVRCSIENGVSMNPYSTDGTRGLWQSGWDGIRPALLVDTSFNWRAWARGCQARLLVESSADQQTPVESDSIERPRG